jgi:hypothetical protein
MRLNVNGKMSMVASWEEMIHAHVEVARNIKNVV